MGGAGEPCVKGNKPGSERPVLYVLSHVRDPDVDVRDCGAGRQRWGCVRKEGAWREARRKTHVTAASGVWAGGLKT